MEYILQEYWAADCHCCAENILKTEFLGILKWINYSRLTIKIHHLFCDAGSRSALFAATDPQVSEYCELLKADEWPVCGFISQDCRPANPSEEAHNTETSYEVWEKTLEMIGLPSDAVEKLLEGEEVKSRYGQEQ